MKFGKILKYHFWPFLVKKHLAIFWGVFWWSLPDKNFSEKIRLCHARGSLTPWKLSEKIEPILKKLVEGRKREILFIGPFRPRSGVQLKRRFLSNNLRYFVKCHAGQLRPSKRFINYLVEPLNYLVN